MEALTDKQVEEYLARLTKQQDAAIQQMLSPKAEGATAVGAEVGTGKTRISMMFAKEHGDQVILIVAPLQTEEGWQNEAAEHLPHLPFKRIKSDEDGKEALDDYQWMMPGVYFVGKEYFVRLGWVNEPVMMRTPDGERVQKRDQKGKLMFRQRRSTTWDTKPDLVIHDEIHAQQNHESLTHKTLMNLDAHYKIGLSGTFTGNSFDGAYATTKWLWPHRAEKNIYTWRSKWALTEYDHFAVRNEKTIGEKDPGAYFASLPSYVFIESIPFPVDDQVIEVVLSGSERRLYDEMEEDMVAWVEDQPVVAELPIVKRIRLRQAALGEYALEDTGKLDPDGDPVKEVVFRDDAFSTKYEKLMAVLDEEFEGEPALILTDSQKFARYVVKRLKGSAEFSGKVTRRKRNRNKEEFINGDLKYLVGVIKAMGTGTNGLQHATRNVVWLSEDESRIENEQALGRLARTGQRRVVRSRRIQARDTLDQGIYSKQLQAAIEAKKIARGRKK